MWVTNLDRLPTRNKPYVGNIPTRSRLALWGMQVQTTCCICSSHPETRDYLMLSCPYAMVLWSEARRNFRDTPPIFNDWSELMQWTLSSSANTPSNLRMLVIQALAYSIWRQRNNMLHKQKLVPPQVAFKEINRHVINTIYACKKFGCLMQLWLR